MSSDVCSRLAVVRKPCMLAFTCSTSRTAAGTWGQEAQSKLLASKMAHVSVAHQLLPGVTFACAADFAACFCYLLAWLR